MVTSFCINPYCDSSEDPQEGWHCRHCGTGLTINGMYRATKKIRVGSDFTSDLYEVINLNDEPAAPPKPRILKILKPNVDPKHLELFEKEYRILKMMTEKGFTRIPRIQDPCSYFPIKISRGPHSCQGLVMEKIEGENLEQWRQNHDVLSESVARTWLLQLAELLQQFHGLGYFHRDIKPSNIMVISEQEVALIDFGSIRVMDSPTFPAEMKRREITRVISVGYTAPEQERGEGRPASDFYGLGQMIIYSLTGKEPQDLASENIDWRSRVPHISDGFMAIIEQLIKPDIESESDPRLTSWDQLIKLLQGEESSSELSVVPPAIEIEIEVEDQPVNQRQANRARGALAKLDPWRSKMALLWKRYRWQSLSTVAVGSAIMMTQTTSIAISLSNRGIEALNNGNQWSAQPLLKIAYFLEPQDDWTLLALGRLYDVSEQWDSARVSYEAMGESLIVYKHNALGRLNLLQNKIQEAEQQLLMAQKHFQDEDPQIMAHVYKNTGWLKLKQQQFGEAKAHLIQAIATDPDLPDSYCLLAQVEQAQGHQTDAIAHWDNCRNKLTPEYNHYHDEVNDWLEGENLLI